WPAAIGRGATRRAASWCCPVGQSAGRERQRSGAYRSWFSRRRRKTVEPVLESQFHGRPLALRDRIEHRVPIAAVRANQLIAERALIAGAELLDRGLRVQVLDVGLQR